MTDLIRWEDNGTADFLGGYPGTTDTCLFEMYGPGGLNAEWTLQSFLPGQVGVTRFGASPDELKPRAEELLREFTASVGAVFPDAHRWQALKDWLTAEIAHDLSVMEDFKDYPDDGVTSTAHGAMASAKRSVLARMRELEQ
jgi:hypothetical protein